MSSKNENLLFEVKEAGSNQVVYRNTLEKARKLRDKLRRRGLRGIIISVIQKEKGVD